MLVREFKSILICHPSYTLVVGDIDDVYLEFDDNFELGSTEEVSSVDTLCNYLDKHCTLEGYAKELVTSGGYAIDSVEFVDNKLVVITKD